MAFQSLMEIVVVQNSAHGRLKVCWTCDLTAEQGWTGQEFPEVAAPAISIDSLLFLHHMLSFSLVAPQRPRVCHTRSLACVEVATPILWLDFAFIVVGVLWRLWKDSALLHVLLKESISPSSSAIPETGILDAG